MSVKHLCDACQRIIYERPAMLEIKVVSRYNALVEEQSKSAEQFELCTGCDMKVADALLPLLPKLAYRIEPNAGKTF